MRENLVAVILAGGAGRRLGLPAKPLALLDGRPLLLRVADAIRPQVEAIVLSHNDPLDLPAGSDLPRTLDSLPGRQGPLAGILSGMDWAISHRPNARSLLSVPADAPFLPPDLASRLAAAAGESGSAYARSGERSHPVIGLWPLARRNELAELLAKNIRRADAWPDHLGAAAVAWPAVPRDPFFNVNTPEDLAAAERFISFPQ